MTTDYIIEDTNLTNAWIQILNRVIVSPGMEITPLLLTLTGFDESQVIREVIDTSLDKRRLSRIQTVSETIFPNSLYILCKKDRHEFYERYKRNLPRIKKIEPKGNGKGTYFERMIAFDGGTKQINQLEIIIKSIDSGKVKRRSKLQIAIFDPRVDHTNGLFQGFPCLQHVTFYLSHSGGLVLNSFYAIQYLYRRGYGNWLGLVNLGKFVANELNIEFEKFNCYIGVEKLDTENISRIDAQKLLRKIS